MLVYLKAPNFCFFTHESPTSLPFLAFYPWIGKHTIQKIMGVFR